MADALPLRIFLASPGDLEDERAAVRTCVDEHNSRREGESGVTSEVVDWDRMRGTARRAQEAIDELIAESHFMIALFRAPGEARRAARGATPRALKKNSSPACSSSDRPSSR
jgi:hypothetical protein